MKKRQMTPEIRASWLAGRTKHGAYSDGKETSTHAIWRGMIARCHNSNSKDYTRYGGLGVVVTERWREFAKFLEDMGERPSGLQLDRFPDPNGNYEPSNCRWATHSENQKNKRSTKRFLWKNKILTASELAAVLGISRSLMSFRLRRGHYADARV